MRNLLIAATVLIAGSTVAPAADNTNTANTANAAYPQAHLLIEPPALQQAIAQGKVVVLDARTRQAYEAGHIATARWVDHDDWSQSFAAKPDADAFSKRIGALGIANDTPVVIYDDQMSKNAARIWWILRYFGHTQAQLLNGGWVTWTAEERPTTQDIPADNTAAFKPQVESRRLTNSDDVLAGLAGSQLQMLDVRSFGEHCGLDKLKNARGGAIPGARHLEWSDLLDDETHRFKSPQQLQALFTESGLDLTRPIATHCQSGGRASVMAFGLELMGGKDVRNYYDILTARGNDESRPIQT